MKNLLLLLLLISCAREVAAQQAGTDVLRQKALTLRRFLEQNHYQPLQWNDTSSVRLYDHWLEILDNEKMLFSKEEIAAVSFYRTRLDEELMGKEWGFYDKTISLYKSVLLRTDSTVKSILDKPLDFSKPDNFRWPLTDYTAGNREIYKAWQQYLKGKVLRAIADVVTDSLKQAISYTQLPANFAALEAKARQQVKKRELLWVQNRLAALTDTPNEMPDEFLSAIGWCYDPHTQYMNAEVKAGFETDMSGLEYSIGFEMEENEKGEWEIAYMVPGGPAWRNGELHKGDIILKIKSGNRPELIMADANMEQLANIFESSSAEKIAVTVRLISGAQKTAVLIKEKITNEEGIVKSYLLTGAKKIGYITLPGFYVKEGDEDYLNGCSNDVAKEVVKLKKDSIEGLILDLRFNGGGSMMEALELAGIFINDGTLTSTRDKTGKVHFLRDPNRGTIYDGPLLVLVNSMSASASELVAAVLQDYHRALIVGSATYGKGSSQVIMPMDTSGRASQTASYDSYVKVTGGKFYRVDGTTTQWKGVIPNIELPDIYAMDRLREKGNLSALRPDLSKTAIYQPSASIQYAELKDSSIARLKNNQQFKSIETFRTRVAEMEGGLTIPLQWTAYMGYYKNITDMYALLEPAPGKLKQITAINTSLDMERIALMPEQSKSVNEINIERIEEDGYITESYRIMLDWLKQL